MNFPNCDAAMIFAPWEFVHLQFYLAANPDFLQTRRIMNPKTLSVRNLLALATRFASQTGNLPFQRKRLIPDGTC